MLDKYGFLFLGDIIGRPGRRALKKFLPVLLESEPLRRPGIVHEPAMDDVDTLHHRFVILLGVGHRDWADPERVGVEPLGNRSVFRKKPGGAATCSQ